MNILPDAPWIVEAEQNGIDAPDPVNCPVCGKECDTIYVDKYGDAFGCDRCIKKVHADEWEKD